MIKRYEIVGFNESKRKITEHITKFGGCPIFLHEQQWPISTGWENRKMMFVGQIVIEKGMLGNEKGIIAYIFITHPGSYNDIFFDPDVAEWGGGENKVIIQNFDDLKGAKPYSQEGPTLFNEKDEMCEYVPILEEGFDVDYLTNEEFRKLTNEQQKEYFTLIDKNKIGGTPNFFQRDAWPEGEWILLLLKSQQEIMPLIFPTAMMSMVSFGKSGGMALLSVMRMTKQGTKSERMMPKAQLCTDSTGRTSLPRQRIMTAKISLHMTDRAV